MGAVSAAIELKAGQSYYISAININRQGRDALSVSVEGGPWAGNTQPIPAEHDGKPVLEYMAGESGVLTACEIDGAVAAAHP